MTAPPSVGLAEAARLCGCSVSTLRRRRDDLLRQGATQTDRGWSIPIPALIALGLMPNSTPPDGVAPRTVTPVMTPPAETPALDALRQQLADTERRLLEAQHRAALAEAVAEERGRALDAERAALRLLTTTPHGSPSPVEPAAAAPAPVDPAPRKWWTRRPR